MEMLNKGDEAHMAAMNKVKEQSPEGMCAWFEEKKAAFNHLAEDQKLSDEENEQILKWTSGI